MSISSEKKKELLQKYKERKPEIGIVAVINKNQQKYLLQTTSNLQGKINSIRFQLNSEDIPIKHCKETGTQKVLSSLKS